MKNIIPKGHQVYQQFSEIAKTTRIVVISGLPGTGKSLYINQFYQIAKDQGKDINLIQWDVARKAFETKEILDVYPMGDGTVHNGLKLIASTWLMDTVHRWLAQYEHTENILLIEAPLVGHRFVALAQLQNNPKFERFLASKKVKFVVPIPTKELRKKIEADRIIQVKETANNWSGAKPSVMLMLYKMVCQIANEFGQKINLDEQPEYDPEIVEFVFGKVLKHRQFIPMLIKDSFDVKIKSESELHSIESIVADAQTANEYLDINQAAYKGISEINQLVNKWYLT